MHSETPPPYVHNGQSGCEPPRPPVLAWAPYDVYTMDALMLFNRAATPRSSNDAPRVGRRRKQMEDVDDEDERRRASHREVQRRFMQRKQAEMAALRSNAAKMELQYRTLLGEIYAEKLRDERKQLLRACEERDIDVEEDDDEEEVEDLGESKLHAPLFQFKLESERSETFTQTSPWPEDATAAYDDPLSIAQGIEDDSRVLPTETGSSD